MSDPLLCHGIHSAARLLYLPLKAFSVLALRTSLSPTAPDRREGYLLSTTHSVLALFRVHRGLGCRHRIRTSSPGYEPGELPLLHHCDIVFISLTLV